MMFKYGRMQRETLFWLARGYRGACLDCTLPGVQVL